MDYKAFQDELEKIAVTLKTLREAAKRIGPKAIPDELAVFGGLTIPTKGQQAGKAVKELHQFQQKMLPPGVAEHLERIITPYARNSPGRIFVGKDAGKMFDPAASPARQRALRTYITAHEGLERSARPALGSLHATPEVAVKDFNLRSTLTGRGSRGVRGSMEPLRRHEDDLLREQLLRATKDPRSAQFMEKGRKVPKAMRKALMRSQPELSVDRAKDIMGAQANALMSKQMQGPAKKVSLSKKHGIATP